MSSTQGDVNHMSRIQNLYGTRLVQILLGFSRPRFEQEQGQTLAEYAMILALIAVTVVGAVELLGGQINSFFSTVGSDI